jgi:hypothetical protein
MGDKNRPLPPSAFIGFAVTMWSDSPTFRGRPNLVPLARDVARLNAVRSFVSSRSYSARDPRTPIIIGPAGVDESMPSVADTGVTPRSVRALTVARMCNVLRPSRSNFHTTTVSPSRTYSISAAGPGRSSRAPDMVSENDHHARCFQSSVLLIECLRDRGDPGVADAGTRTGCSTSRIAHLTHKC